ncbi:MAG: hypothetical protein ACHQ01_07030 [Candidatus Limnocylindrales bacterium]
MGSDQRAALDIEADEQFVDGLFAETIRHLRITPDRAELGQGIASLAKLNLVRRHCLSGLRALQATPSAAEYVDANRSRGQLSLKLGPS